jgi:hypothetical protein
MMRLLSGRVCTYSDGGGLYMTGNQVDTKGGGVRPAIWIDISPKKENDTTTPSAPENETQDKGLFIENINGDIVTCYITTEKITGETQTKAVISDKNYVAAIC